MRDCAWRITRSHPYLQEWNCLPIKKKGWEEHLGSAQYEKNYMACSKKEFWIVGPTYDFANNVMANQYLLKMIPEWFIKEIKYTNQKNIDSITFKNGDILRVKTYSQGETSKMGYSIDVAYVDEMCNDFQTLSEIKVRTFDKDGYLTMAFTPLVINQEIRLYLDSSCKSGTTSLHKWSLYDNPWYRDNPERLREALNEYAALPANLRKSRLSGEWYEEILVGAVFEGLEPEVVDDFDIPLEWRRVRYTDPAARVTGHVEFAEDPQTGYWYCYLGKQISWGEGVGKAEDILDEIDKFKPTSGFEYAQSVYDNAEAWFYAYAKGRGYIACIEKNRDAAIIATRSMIELKKLKFFAHGAAGALVQLRSYHFNKNETGKVVKKDDHILDCVMYFCRQHPAPLVMDVYEGLTEHQRIAKVFNESKERKSR